MATVHTPTLFHLTVQYHNTATPKPLKTALTSAVTPLFCGNQSKPKVALLTLGKTHKETPVAKALISECKRLDFDIELIEIHPQELVLQVNDDQMTLWMDDQEHRTPPFDYLFPLVDDHLLTDGVLTAIDFLERMGVQVINSPDAIRIAENETASHIALAKAHIPQPASLYRPPLEREEEDPSKASVWEDPNRGRRGYFLYTTDQLAALGPNITIRPNRAVSNLHQTWAYRDAQIQDVNKRVSPHHYVQALLTSSDTQYGNLRYYVFDGDVIYATQLDKAGGNSKPVQIDAKTKQLALQAATAAGMTYGSVDLIQANDQIMVLDIDASPAINKNNQDDIAQGLFAYTQAHLPQHKPVTLTFA